MNDLTCHAWPGGRRCLSRATVWLVAPDGVRVPAGWRCDTHAGDVLREYRDRLGESWTAQPLALAEKGA